MVTRGSVYCGAAGTRFLFEPPDDRPMKLQDMKLAEGSVLGGLWAIWKVKERANQGTDECE